MYQAVWFFVWGDDDRVRSIEASIIVLETFFPHSTYLVERVVDFKPCRWNKMWRSCCISIHVSSTGKKKRARDTYKNFINQKTPTRLKNCNKDTYKEKTIKKDVAFKSFTITQIVNVTSPTCYYKLNIGLMLYTRKTLFLLLFKKKKLYNEEKIDQKPLIAQTVVYQIIVSVIGSHCVIFF